MKMEKQVFGKPVFAMPCGDKGTQDFDPPALPNPSYHIWHLFLVYVSGNSAFSGAGSLCKFF